MMNSLEAYSRFDWARKDFESNFEDADKERDLKIFIVPDLKLEAQRLKKEICFENCQLPVHFPQALRIAWKPTMKSFHISSSIALRCFGKTYKLQLAIKLALQFTNN